MSKKFSKKPLAAAVGSAVAATLSMAPAVNAEQNPFSMNELSSGYMQVVEGEMKCGSNMKEGEGSCGGKKAGKDVEGKCAGDKSEKKAEGKCGEGKCGGSKKEGEGKCGEGKCGGDKKPAEAE